jgi:hypothetical protein
MCDGHGGDGGGIVWITGNRGFRAFYPISSLLLNFLSGVQHMGTRGEDYQKQDRATDYHTFRGHQKLRS